MYTPKQNAELLARHGLPKAPGKPLEVRWVMGHDSWYCRTKTGWYWLRRANDPANSVWDLCPMGPLY